MDLKASLEQLFEIANKRDEIHSGFIKQVLLMSSGLLGILVSLHKTSSEIYYSKLSFSLAVGLLSFGILLLTIALSAEVSKHKAIFMRLKAEILAQIKDPTYSPQMVYGNPSKLYKFFEVVGYLALSLSVISLATYAILIS